MVILIQCADRIGLVAAIAKVLAERRLNIVAMREHVDQQVNRFFARIVSEQEAEPEALRFQLIQALPAEAQVTINPNPNKKIVVLVTKEYHCLGDILVRNHFNTLGASVQAVIGNHTTLSNLCERFDIPFYFISHEQKTKEQFEAALYSCLAQFDPEYLVLAKFMRILSPEFVNKFPTQIINIHHSFLPAFVGASPYTQAYERGVKLIGATAHFVTNQLDEGPIIHQEIIQVNHTYLPQDMVKAGKEIEKKVLAKAMQQVFEDRVFVYNNKTIVFD